MAPNEGNSRNDERDFFTGFTFGDSIRSDIYNIHPIENSKVKWCLLFILCFTERFNNIAFLNNP